jgi:two-component sensor histidine kinase
MPLPARDPLRLSIVADVDAPAAARRGVGGLVGRLDEDLLVRSRLIVTELVTNSVQHAAPGQSERIELLVSVHPERLRIEVIDGGHGFEPDTPELSRHQTSGWGLWLVDQLTDRWGVDEEQSTRVWCEIDHPTTGSDRLTATPAPDSLPQRDPAG